MLNFNRNAEGLWPQHTHFPPKHRDSRYNRCTLLASSVVRENFASCFGGF